MADSTAPTIASAPANVMQKVSAITLFVDDLPSAKAFYVSVFEARICYEAATSCAMKLENLLLNLMKRPNGAGSEPAEAPVGNCGTGHRFILSIWVDELDPVVARLKEKGVKLLSGPVKQPWGMYTATFADPAGHTWEVGQDLTKSSS